MDDRPDELSFDPATWLRQARPAPEPAPRPRAGNRMVLALLGSALLLAAGAAAAYLTRTPTAPAATALR